MTYKELYPTDNIIMLFVNKYIILQVKRNNSVLLTTKGAPSIACDRSRDTLSTSRETELRKLLNYKNQNTKYFASYINTVVTSSIVVIHLPFEKQHLRQKKQLFRVTLQSTDRI